MSTIQEQTQSGDTTTVGVVAGTAVDEAVPVGKLRYDIRAFDKDGNLLWEESICNLVTTGGKNDLLDKYFKGSGYTAAWFVGLKGTGAPAASDTMASHPSWSEVTAYSETTRRTLTLGTVTGGSVNNSASPATFSISGAVTIAGAFTCSNSTKGGTSGVLYSVGDFASARTLGAGDTAQVVITLSTT